MNNKWIYVPFGLFFLATVFLLSNEVDHINLQPDRNRYLLVCSVVAVFLALWGTLKVKPYLNELNVYQVFPIFLIFTALFSFTYLSIINRSVGDQSCDKQTVEVESYLGRYASGYGQIIENAEATHYVLHFKTEEGRARIVSVKPIFPDKNPTKDAQLWFCRGILGFEYVNF